MSPLIDRAPSALPGDKIQEARAQDMEPREDEKARVSNAYDEEEGLEDAKPRLPFSKARCIALVATLTGASFLNVCQWRLREGVGFGD